MCVVSSLSQNMGRGSGDPLILYSNRVLPPFYPCHDNYLKLFKREKHYPFTLFLLLLPFQRANRRLEPTYLLSQEMQTGGLL